MPISHKKLTSKKWLKHQFCDINSDQFIMQYLNSEDEYKYESTDDNYSTDSPDENYCNQKISKLENISFIWTNKSLIIFSLTF